jgi:hypothetical protein
LPGSRAREGGALAGADDAPSEPRALDDGREHGIDDALTREGPGRGCALHGARFDDQQLGVSKPLGQARGEAVGGDRPIAGNATVGGAEFRRQPDGDVPETPGAFHGGQRVRRDEPRFEPDHGGCHLVHGEQRHVVSRTVREAQQGLGCPNRIGEGTAPRHHDHGAAGAAHECQKRAEPAGFGEAAPELEHDRRHARPGRAR